MKSSILSTIPNHMKDLSFIESLDLVIEAAKLQANKAFLKSTEDIDAIVVNLAMLEDMAHAHRSTCTITYASDTGKYTPMHDHIAQQVERLTQLVSSSCAAAAHDATGDVPDGELLTGSSYNHLGKCCFLLNSMSTLRSQFWDGVAQLNAGAVEIPNLEATETLGFTALGFSGDIDITKSDSGEGNAAHQSMGSMIEELIVTCSGKVKEVGARFFCNGGLCFSILVA